MEAAAALIFIFLAYAYCLWRAERRASGPINQDGENDWDYGKGGDE